MQPTGERATRTGSTSCAAIAAAQCRTLPPDTRLAVSQRINRYSDMENYSKGANCVTRNYLQSGSTNWRRCR